MKWTYREGIWVVNYELWRKFADASPEGDIRCPSCREFLSFKDSDTVFDGTSGWSAMEKQRYTHKCGTQFVIMMK